MHPPGREALTEAQSFLQSHLVITEALLRSLRQQQVLEERDCTRIKAEVSNESRLRTFSNIVQYKPEDSFSKLLVALEDTKSTHVANHLRQREKAAQENCEKLQEQLPHWLRGRYCECPGRWTALHEVVQKVQSELFSGLSEPCISSLLTQVLPTVYTTARIEGTGLQPGHRTVQNIISNMALHQVPKWSAQSSSSDETGVQARINPPLASGASVESTQSHLQGTSDQEKTLQQKQPNTSHLQDNKECSPSAPSMMANISSSSTAIHCRLDSASVSDKQLPKVVSAAVSKPVERLFPRTEHQYDDVPGSFNLDLPSCDTAIQATNPGAGRPTDQQFLYKDMATWDTEDVCTWLGTVKEIGESEINQFRTAKIKGKALKKMTEDKMSKYFPELAIGDILEILEERDNFQPQSVLQMRLGSVEELPCPKGPTVHVYPNDSLDTTIPHPVQCTSHHLDMFTRQKSDAEERRVEVTCTPPLGQTTTVPVPPVGEMDPTMIQQESVLTEGEQPDSQETLDKQEDKKSEPTHEGTKDSFKTPVKGATESDPRETPQKRPIENKHRETPLKQPIKNDPREIPMKLQIENNPSETPLKPPEANTKNPQLKTHSKSWMRDQKDMSQKIKSVSKVPDPSTLKVNTSDLDRETPLKCMDPVPSPDQESPELSTCRTFDTAVGLKTYGLGNTFPDHEGMQSGRIKMVRKFVDQGSIKTNKEKVLFMVETVTFLSACLNERYNGTIHFGVTSQDESQEGQGKSEIIKGVHFDHARREEFEEMLRKSLQKCFAEDQADIVFHCLRPVQYIPVVDPQKGEPTRDLFVIEVRVSPTADLCAAETFFVKIPSYNRKKKVSYSEESKFFRVFDGEIRACGPEELQTYMHHNERIAEDHKRKQAQEDMAKAKTDAIESDLYLKLCDRLCKVENNMPVDLYPILVVNKPPESMSEEDMKKSLSFLADVQFKVTFDFDNSGKLSEYVENIEEKPLKIISTADDFKDTSDANMRKPDRLKNLQTNIKNSRDQFWIFTNGHRKDRETTYEWKRGSQEGFREAVRFYRREIPEGRALVMFLLLSEDQDVMLAAAEDLITSFTDQWIVISESEHLADNWAKELVRRNCIDEKTWKENSITGMPLSQISESVKRIQGPVRHTHPMLPTATGTYIPLREALADLDVLSAEECENYQTSPPPRSTFEIQKEEEFYKGGPVDWWNFWYQHVLARSKLHDLKKLISSALKRGINEEDQYVGRIHLYHQNGAGGTTLAMNALWEYRKTHRCAIVNNISDAAQTAEQILQLRAYGENHHSPNPVLVLLDNQDEEKSNFLLAYLVERAKQITRMDSGKLKVFCVLISCKRRNQLPVGYKDKRILLRHELDTPEQKWFKKKYQELSQNHQDQLIGDPKLLISFNIMKENFDQKYMKRTVEGLLADVTDQAEKKLLKFVALLNAFDIQNQAIPTSAFDMMMSKMIWQPGLRYGRGAYQQRWECNLSAAIRVLLNATSQVSMGYINAIQIASPLLSKHILDAMQAHNSVKQTTSEMAMEFFNTSNIFSYPSVARDNLLKIVKDILKMRQRTGAGVPRFAPIIQEIVNKETTDKAGEVMEKGFQITNDPFVAQQLARLYIHAKNWERAKHFAKTATDMASDNSFLWDTYGRVYLGELKEYCQTISTPTADKYTKPQDWSVFVECAFKGMEIFKHVQKLNHEEKHTTVNNDAGYFGELQMIGFLLDCLSCVQAFDTSEHMKQFLTDRTCVVPAMCELDSVVDDACLKLKGLFENSKHAITHLEDESIQLKGNLTSDSQRDWHFNGKEKLKTLKGKLDSYFGEKSDKAPEIFTEEAKCQYRRRRLFQLDANSMMRIFDLKNSANGEEELDRMKGIVMHNINTTYETADDLQVVMCVNLALVQIPIEDTDYTDYTSGIVFEDMVNMSQRLYEKRGTRNFIYLEPFLFYVMFNWPQNDAKTKQSTKPLTRPISHRMLTDALRKWKEAYYEKYPKQRDKVKPYRKKDMIIFFFGTGSGMDSIISQDSLSLERESQKSEVEGERFWNEPEIQKTLKRFQGILCSDGDEVELTIEYPSGNKDTLNIPTSFPIRKRQWWNKQVYFVIGFSWKGPKAFAISMRDPTAGLQHKMSDYTHQIRDEDTGVRPRQLRPVVHTQNQHRLESNAEKLSRYAQKPAEIAKLKSLREAGEHLNPSQVQLTKNEGFYQTQHDRLSRQSDGEQKASV